MNKIAITLVAWISLAVTVSATNNPIAAAELIDMGLSERPVPATSTNSTQGGTNTLIFTLTGPGYRDFSVTAPTQTWFGFSELNGTLSLSESAPTQAQILVFLKDWDYLWYQQLLPDSAAPGESHRFRVDLSPTATRWETQGHYSLWHARTLMEPREFGIRVFLNSTGTITGTLSNVFAKRLPASPTPPTIRNVRPATQQLPCYEKFEATFDLPDRYANPFDPEEVAVTARIETPDGKTVSINGFHSHDYFRTIKPTGTETLPQGPPHWKIRYTPTRAGTYRYTLHVQDTQGSTTWGPGEFMATPSPHPGFVRVSKSDPRYFEFDNGDFFFPIGHNIRSPSDSRMNSAFPWAKRWTEGTDAYARYFSAMRNHGENMAEIWMAAWSLGLEWSPQWRGYHGIGQYNLMNAWEMDQVIDEADRNGIILNVVIHNHGKFSSIVDNEWSHNPFNKKAGGYLEKPDEYFTQPRARKDFHQLMRYIIARWGYSPRIFAWELWSELNITGSYREFYKSPECVDWHQAVAREINDLDPNKHLITTHYCPDFAAQNTNITALSGITHAAVDAYHNESRTLKILDLLAATAQFNNPFGKPVLITEFGGASSAQGLVHLENSLHAALWASTCIPIAGTPFFWWWGLIEEENYYPEYLAISRFMKDEDRRDPSLLSHTPVLTMPPAPGVNALSFSLKNNTRALGWIYDAPAFEVSDTETHPTLSNLVVRLDNMTNGMYRIEFWNTTRGEVTQRQTREVKDTKLTLTVPPFSRDIAFKVKRQF